MSGKIKLWSKIVQRLADSEVSAILVTSIAVTAILLGVRHLGGLQSWELAVYDEMVRLRSDPGPDSRLLVVGITEKDIRQTLKRWPPSDAVLAQVLAELQRHNPKAIGLDLVRDITYEPGHNQLVTQLKKTNIIAITFIGNTDDETIPPPLIIPKERVGFSDVINDVDGLTRRNLMFTTDGKTSFHSLSLRLALAYLADKGIKPQITDSKDYQLGKSVFVKLKANSGGYQNIDAGGYQILLNYRSPNVARQVTLTQVLNKEIDPALIKDKIILIGATAPSVKDFFLTPYNAAERGNPQTPGVLLHAQMVSQFLGAVIDNKPLFWYADEWLEMLWIAGWAIVGSIIGWRVHNPLVFGLLAIASLGVLFGCGFVLFMQGGWIPLAAPAIALMVTGGFAIVYQIQQSRQQQQMVMKLLGQQTSPEIANALWKERDRLLKSGILAGQKLTATILFSDIKGFSTISEEKPPDLLMSWLNEYLRAMSHEIIAHQGVINKYMGDGIMAVFGVPIERSTEAEIAADAVRSVNCALAMGKRLKELNRDWESRNLPVIQIRAGIFTGPVMVGSLGGTEHLEYGVIGDSTNTAARLESCEKDRQVDDCRILIAKQTLIHLQGQFEVEFWGPLELKGKQQTVDVYRVISCKLESISKES
ncbi:CHASE2 domain-containing protein [Argonema antarcticum]|uniref:CHASE2 domain-containing protein n=1 Tax=Argonema antarcticum TaxID=2942763 RepID=UPI002011A30D|nr:adenylate/guanylate cyclase domain-containing protein [Argonema antarcticum]MCL1470413.1 adenylate/guanylate cyclase domain-containing protein [Argonema antarcticum A004/B2]